MSGFFKGFASESDSDECAVLLLMKCSSYEMRLSHWILHRFRDLPAGEDKSALIDKMMEYVKNDDVRNLKRLLGRRSRDDVNILCNIPSRTGWSSVTSAADFGNVDVLK